jgi:hypothetical protein
MQVTSCDYQNGSTEFLALIARHNCHIVLEKAAPAGRLKRDFVSIKSPDGRDLELSNPQGFRVCPVQLPREILDDYLRHSFVKQDGPEDENGRITYRLTNDGRERGSS